jgi:hypothetical protein
MISNVNSLLAALQLKQTTEHVSCLLSVARVQKSPCNLDLGLYGLHALLRNCFLSAFHTGDLDSRAKLLSVVTDCKRIS